MVRRSKAAASNKRKPRRRRAQARRPAPRQELVDGIVKLLPDGVAQAIPQKGRGSAKPIHIAHADSTGLNNGDRVTLRLVVGRKGRVQGRVVERKAALPAVQVGTVFSRRGTLLVRPNGGGPPVRLRDKQGQTVKDGDAVVIDMSDPGAPGSPATCDVSQVLGRADHAKVQLDMAVVAQGLPTEFAPKALSEAKNAPAVDPKEVLKGPRQDLRETTHVTIDGEDARDFDDAVAAKVEGNNIRIWVSIADVSSYVIDGSALDQEARARGTSVYFPHRVVPMLPEALSNELCSLKPGVPRLTLTCEMLVNKSGRPSDVAVYPSLIKSAGRLTYTQVQQVLTGDAPEKAGLDDDLQALVHLLTKAARWFRAERAGRGALDFDIPEPHVKMSDKGVPLEISARERVESHRVIEDLMVAANEAVARTLLKTDWPTLYRVHEPPDVGKLRIVRQWAKRLGIKITVENIMRTGALKEFASRIADRDQSQVGHTLLLRSMQQARYATENLGHYGLASSAYLHFTSPIRRYPDLLVHRALWQTFSNKPKPQKELSEEATSTSSLERRAVVAERDVLKLIGCQIALGHVGETFVASITGVIESGVFVRPNDLFVEGLVFVENIGQLHDDYMDFVPDSLCFVGRRTGVSVGVGDTIEVVLAKVDPALRRIDFVPAGLDLERSAARGERRPKPTLRRKAKTGAAGAGRRGERKKTGRKPKAGGRRRKR